MKISNEEASQSNVNLHITHSIVYVFRSGPLLETLAYTVQNGPTSSLVAWVWPMEGLKNYRGGTC